MKFIKTLIASAVFWPLLVLAQPYGGFRRGYSGRGGGFYQPPTRANVQTLDQVLEILRSLIAWGQIIAAFVAVLFFLYGAFKFISGDAAGGRNALVYAAIGLAVAILAFAVVPVVCTLLDASGPACELPIFG